MIVSFLFLNFFIKKNKYEICSYTQNAKGEQGEEYEPFVGDLKFDKYSIKTINFWKKQLEIAKSNSK